MIKLTLKPIQTISNNFYTQQWHIKRGRKIEAKVFEHKNGDFSLETSGLQFTKRSLKECQDHIINNITGFVNALGFSKEIVSF